MTGMGDARVGSDVEERQRAQVTLSYARTDFEAERILALHELVG